MSDTKTCSNCGRTPHGDRLRRGLCMSCYRYWRKHGHNRPASKRIRGPYDPAPMRPPCANCKQAMSAGRHGLCRACYQYRNTTGKRRPPHLWKEECRVCGKPKSSGFAKGLCPTCYNYRRKNGRDRSSKLVERNTPYGHCDCGMPAVTVLNISINERAMVDMPLCAACLAIEESMR